MKSMIEFRLAFLKWKLLRSLKKSAISMKLAILFRGLKTGDRVVIRGYAANRIDPDWNNYERKVGIISSIRPSGMVSVKLDDKGELGFNPWHINHC